MGTIKKLQREFKKSKNLAGDVYFITQAMMFLIENLPIWLKKKPEQVILNESGDEIINKDTKRLNFLIEWLGLNDTLEGSGIRDWVGRKNAREEIDKAIDDKAIEESKFK